MRLARDARPETPAPKKLSAAERAELEARVKQRTMDLAWAMTKRSIETTARAVVDQILGRGFVAAAAAGAGAGSSANADAQPASGPTGARTAHGHGQGGGTAATPAERELQARADALVLVGGLFSGEKPHEAVDRAVGGLHRLASTATVASSTARSLLGGWLTRGTGNGQQGQATRALPPTAATSDASSAPRSASPPSAAARVPPPPPPPPESLGAFFKEMMRSDTTSRQHLRDS